MVCMGFKPAAAGWQAQMKPRTYGTFNLVNLNDAYC